MRRPETRGVRARLIAVNLVVFGLVLAVTLGVAALSTEEAADRATDQVLRETRARVVQRLEHERHERYDRHERGPIALAGERSAWVLLIASDDSVVGSSAPVPPGLPEAAGLAAARAGHEDFRDGSVDGEPARILSVAAPGAGEGAVLQVARSTAEAQASSRRTLLILLVTGAGGLVLAALGSAFLAARAMRPIDAAIERQRAFLADASHELRTPAAVIRARAELLARSDGEAARAELEQLAGDAEELSRLLERMLDLARLDAGTMTLAIAPTPLGEVAEEVAAQLAPLAARAQVRVEVAPSDRFVLADLTALRQIVRALLDNAIKHSPAGGRVRVSVGGGGARGELSIVDEGEGIPPAALPHVKERFFRADSARARAPGEGAGAGLGLAIASELLARMNGWLDLESEVGRGTTVRLSLPVA